MNIKRGKKKKKRKRREWRKIKFGKNWAQPMEALIKD